MLSSKGTTLGLFSNTSRRPNAEAVEFSTQTIVGPSMCITTMGHSPILFHPSNIFRVCVAPPSRFILSHLFTPSSPDPHGHWDIESSPGPLSALRSQQVQKVQEVQKVSEQHTFIFSPFPSAGLTLRNTPRGPLPESFHRIWRRRWNL